MTEAAPDAGELDIRRDAARYRRLQILGCAPCDTPQLANGTVVRFTGLDELVDADLRAYRSRGEARLITLPETTQLAAPAAHQERTEPPIVNLGAARRLAQAASRTPTLMESLAEQIFALASEVERLREQGSPARAEWQPLRDAIIEHDRLSSLQGAGDYSSGFRDDDVDAAAEKVMTLVRELTKVPRDPRA